MNKIKLAIIYGGKSNEHDVSILSYKSIINEIDKTKYNITSIYIDKAGNFLENNKKIKSIYEYLKTFDVIFPILHGKNGEDGNIEGMLELIEVPYVGSKVASSSICMDKIFTKLIISTTKIKQANYIYLKNINKKYFYNNKKIKLKEINKLIIEKLKYPVFIKPSRSGSSIGINECKSFKQLKKCLEISSLVDNKIIIEEKIIGRELEVGVLGNDELLVTEVGEILNNNKFYDYKSKYINSFKTSLAPNIDSSIILNIKESAKTIYNLLDCKCMSRIDFFLEKDTNSIIFNEINTIPGFTKISMYPKLCETLNISYKELINKLINYALK